MSDESFVNVKVIKKLGLKLSSKKPLEVVTLVAPVSSGAHMVDLYLNEGFRVHVIDNLIGGRLQNLEQHKGNSDLRVDTRECARSNPAIRPMPVPATSCISPGSATSSPPSTVRWTTRRRNVSGNADGLFVAPIEQLLVTVKWNQRLRRPACQPRWQMKTANGRKKQRPNPFVEVIAAAPELFQLRNFCQQLIRRGLAAKCVERTIAKCQDPPLVMIVQSSLTLMPLSW